MNNLNYVIEGLDRLGKNCLIDGLQNALGFKQVIDFGKPKKLDAYDGDLRVYQHQSFKHAMMMLATYPNLIFNRSWIGEAVYAEMYRGYSGDYVFELERRNNMAQCRSTKLILLTEDFSVSKHFVSDGESFDDSKRQEEQDRFISAYNKSSLPDKQIVNVTAVDGNFRDAHAILAEVLQSSQF